MQLYLPESSGMLNKLEKCKPDTDYNYRHARSATAYPPTIEKYRWNFNYKNDTEESEYCK